MTFLAREIRVRLVGRGERRRFTAVVSSEHVRIDPPAVLATASVISHPDHHNTTPEVQEDHAQE